METLTRLKAIELYEELVDALANLAGAIRQHCNGVVVYELPTVDAESVVPTHIPVTRTGSYDTVDTRALDLACDAITHLYRVAGQKSTTTYRLPGVLSLSIDMSDSVLAVNALKDRLQKHLMEAYPDTVNRSRACKRLFPGVHMNHLYRHLHLIPPNISRLNITWQCQTPADVWISTEEAVEMTEAALEEETRKTSSGTLDKERFTALQIALRYFSQLPASVELSEADLDGMRPDQIPFQLVRRNYVRPHPRAQLFDPAEKISAVHTHPANLPLIRIPSGTALSVRDLKDYKAGQSRKRADTKRGFEEISQILHIYGGYPTMDNYRRRLKLLESAQQRKNKHKQTAA